VGRFARVLASLKPSSRLLFESALIVFSVLLGFALTEWRASVADRELASRVLTDVVAEVEQNLATLNGQIAQHRQMIESLRAVDAAATDASGWDIAISAMSGGPGAVPMRQAAWQATVSSGALRLMDYDISAALSDIYTTQIDVYGDVAGPATHLFIPESFRPDARSETVQLFLWSMIILEGQERYLKAVYEEHLPTLRQRMKQPE
jgi:hypothetical protein